MAASALEEDIRLLARADPIIVKVMLCCCLWVLWMSGSSGLFVIAGIGTVLVLAIMFAKAQDGYRWGWDERQAVYGWHRVVERRTMEV